MHCTSGDAGIKISYSFNPPTPIPTAVPSDSSRTNGAKLVVLQGRITGRQRSPLFRKQLRSCEGTHSAQRQHTHRMCICTHDQHTGIQGGSNMTGTDLCVNKCKHSRSYLNHIVQYSLKYASVTSALSHMCVTKQRSILRRMVLISLYFLLLSLFGQLPFTNDDSGR